MFVLLQIYIFYRRLEVTVAYKQQIISTNNIVHTCMGKYIREYKLHASLYLTYRGVTYRNDPKFSDRYAWANTYSADPDQTAPRKFTVSDVSPYLVTQ